MITVSPEFEAAQEADSSFPAYATYLALPNYAASGAGTTITSSGDDVSGNYPKEGVIDSDHTEINIGAASAADNGVGKSSWKSDLTPDGSGNVWLVLSFNATRKINRIKLYNLASDPITSYLLQYWNESSWVDFAGTIDRYTPTPGGTGSYGSGKYGDGPYGGVNPWWPGAGATGGLDQYDFETITTTQIRLLIYATQSGGVAQLVELEAFQLVDITSRILEYKGPDRKKDFKLSQPIATQEVLTVDNSDRFFSPSYSPTAAEIAAGFVNSELGLLGIGLEVNEGFYTASGIELIRTFTGSIDSITPVAGSAQSEIVARDGIKHLIDHQDSCRLKTSIDISDCIRYILNRNGISDYEMTLATTTIVQPYFFYYESSLLTVIQELVQASGDALFYFDESGNAIFQYFLELTPQAYNVNTKAGWEAGTLTNIDSTSTPNYISRAWWLLDDFAGGDYSKWTKQVDSGSTTFLASPGYLQFGASGSTSRVGGDTPCAESVGVKTFNIDPVGTGSYAGSCVIMFFQVGVLSDLAVYPYDNIVASGYGLRFNFTADLVSSRIYLVRFDNSKISEGTELLLCGDYSSMTSAHQWSISRSASGAMSVYKDNVLVDSVTDNTYLNAGYFGVAARASSGAGNMLLNITDIYYSTQVGNITNALSNLQAIYLSPVIDRGATVNQAGILNCSSLTPSGTSLLVETAVSDDGISFEPWRTATIGEVDPSEVKRYELIRITFTDAGDIALGTLATPTIYNLSLNWFTGTGQSKWNSSVDFYINDQNGICDLSEQISDTLAGDTAIINDVAVTAEPLVLTGTDADDQWQCITGTPPDKVSASNPLIVAVGTVTYNCVIQGGMDTSGMAGGSCIAITWGTATGTAAISYIHPIKPILTLTVTAPGTIEDLRLIGKSFSKLQTPYQSLASDSTSIFRHRKRHSDVNNNYFRDGSICDLVASRIIANQKDPVSYIPNFDIFPPRLNMQPGDRVNVINEITGIATDYYVAGYFRHSSVSDKGAEAGQSLILMKIPAS